MRVFELGGCTLALTAVLGLSLAEPANAQAIEVAQESAPGVGDFDSNVLGVIGTVDTTMDVVSYYSYGVPFRASFNGPAPVTVNRVSYVFVLNSTTANELSLVIVHDEPEDGTGGGANTGVAIKGDPDGAQIEVKDDPANDYTGDPGDFVFTAIHTWGSCCTDGWAIGSLDGAWEAVVEFTAAPVSIDTWRAYSGTGAEIDLALETGRRIRLRPTQCAPAFWQNYGRGWPGTNGVPRFTSVGDPVLGSKISLSIANSAGVPTSAALFVGVTPTALPTPLGATLLVKPIVIVNIGLTILGQRFPLKIPTDPRLCGGVVYAQVWELDRGASHGLSASAGLELHLGT